MMKTIINQDLFIEMSKASHYQPTSSCMQHDPIFPLIQGGWVHRRTVSSIITSWYYNIVGENTKIITTNNNIQKEEEKKDFFFFDKN